jgi:hypothetical protein
MRINTRSVSRVSGLKRFLPSSELCCKLVGFLRTSRSDVAGFGLIVREIE